MVVATGLGVLGAVFVGGGLFGILRESTNHSACKSDIGQVGQALSQNMTHQCGVDTAIFYAGYAAVMIGILLMIAAAGIGLQHQPTRRRPAPSRPRPQVPPVPPGWYPDPADFPWVRWWDGYRWGPPSWMQPPTPPAPRR